MTQQEKKIVTYPKKTNFSVKTMKMFFQSETWELYSALKLGKSASYLNIEPTIFFKKKNTFFSQLALAGESRENILKKSYILVVEIENLTTFDGFFYHPWYVSVGVNFT